jgi:hypothetical protein
LEFAIMLGESPELIPPPGDGPAEWRKYFKYPVGVGVAMVALAAAIGILVDEGLANSSRALDIVRALLCIGGVTAMGLAVWLRPRAVPVLVLACATCLLARIGFSPDWDSGRLLAGFLAIATGIGALLMALPQLYRRIGVSLIVLYHLGGLFAAVTGPSTQGNPPPWLSQMAGAYLYRPYSQFIYLINAYHFYSPDPGPASQIWFCITYADSQHSIRWHKLPRRPEDMTDPLALEYYRRLSLTEQLANFPRGIPDEARRRRYQNSVSEKGILRHPLLTEFDQYRPPSESVAGLMLPSFIRHVAQLPVIQHNETDPETGKPYAVSKIKVYRVEHQILPPWGMQGSEPFSPDTYRPYYQGEYYADGTPTDPNDPMLFWLVPIFYQPIDPSTTKLTDNPKNAPEKFRLYDGLLIHTGSRHDLK